MKKPGYGRPGELDSESRESVCDDYRLLVFLFPPVEFVNQRHPHAEVAGQNAVLEMKAGIADQCREILGIAYILFGRAGNGFPGDFQYFTALPFNHYIRKAKNLIPFHRRGPH